MPLDRFGEGGTFRRAMVGGTGFIVCGIALAAAITMIARPTRDLKRLGREKI